MKNHPSLLALLSFALMISLVLFAPRAVRAQQEQSGQADGAPKLTGILPGFNGEIDSPSKDDNWTQGRSYPVDWSGFDGDKVIIKLYKGTKLKKTRTTDNDGETIWTVDKDVSTGSNYRFLIVDEHNPFDYAWSDEFSIGSNTRMVIYPSDSGITWKRGGTYTIQWEGFSSDDVKIDLFLGPLLVDSRTSSNDGHTDWTVNDDLIDGSDYKIRISENGDDSQNAWSDHSFGIKGSTAKVDSPNSSGVTWKRGKKYAVKWEGFSGSRVRIELWKGAVPVDWKEADNNGSMNWSVSSKAAKGSDYKIRIQSIDRPTQFDFSDKSFKVQ